MQATIYVTDDEPAIRSAIVKRLSRRHHTVTGFESGEDLVSAVTQQAPDLILLDLKMPGMGGIEALRTIRPLAPHTLIIMLTAYGTVENAVEAMRLGAYDFLIKSVDLSGVDPVVDRALEFLAHPGPGADSHGGRSLPPVRAALHPLPGMWHVPLPHPPMDGPDRLQRPDRQHL